MTMNDRRSIDAINRTAAAHESNYVTADLGIKKSDDETINIISSTLCCTNKYKFIIFCIKYIHTHYVFYNWSYFP